MCVVVQSSHCLLQIPACLDTMHQWVVKVLPGLLEAMTSSTNSQQSFWDFLESRGVLQTSEQLFKKYKSSVVENCTEIKE